MQKGTRAPREGAHLMAGGLRRCGAVTHILGGHWGTHCVVCLAAAADQFQLVGVLRTVQQSLFLDIVVRLYPGHCKAAPRACSHSILRPAGPHCQSQCKLFRQNRLFVSDKPEAHYGATGYQA